MKRVLSYILALAMVFAMMPAVYAASISGAVGDGLTWTLSADGTLTISGEGEMSGLTWDERELIGDAPWLEWAKEITSVVVDEGVTSIGDAAFSRCTRLTSVTLPDSLVSIGENAFLACASLEEILLPEGLEELGYMAFNGCHGLTSIAIPAGITDPDLSDTILNCDGLQEILVAEDNPAYCVVGGVLYDEAMTTAYLAPNGLRGDVVIPDGVTRISYSAFNGCEGITSVAIPDSVTIIDNGAFGGCRGLTELELPDGLTVIEACAFDYCSGLTRINIPDGVTTIGLSAFNSCTSLTNIVIPGSVTKIESSAFWLCKSLTNIEFKGSVPAFGENVFYGVNSIVYYPGDNSSWTEAVRQDYQGNLTWVKKGEPVFHDVMANDWYGEAVMACVDAGVVNGYDDGTFKPHNTVTRAEAAKMIVEASGVELIQNATFLPFLDLSGHWAKWYIVTAEDAGFMKGVDFYSFDPNGKMNRAQLAALIVQTLRLTSEEGSAQFSDVSAQWYAPHVAMASAAGYVKGYEDGTYQPDKNVTRAEFSTIIYRMYLQD